ncbi:uncharacterized protein PgNI_02110 [Pyricularia grisea]|uniref:Uncharacterized protein n=1 Tax=Pyricularia grisea TaxID=148305 RepID=A0A6P8BIU0_PYRGI|nr:uncharacterized protein PgNI_02110 [Pyricularia grisea]TLD16559.1 hypothetical protein PgNI_02110 [Pyricularia grisea]
MAVQEKKVFTTFSADPCRCFPKNRWSDWCEAQNGATSRPANWALGPPNSAKIRSPSEPLQWDCVNFRCWGRDLQGCVLGYFHGRELLFEVLTHTSPGPGRLFNTTKYYKERTFTFCVGKLPVLSNSTHDL